MSLRDKVNVDYGNIILSMGGAVFSAMGISIVKDLGEGLKTVRRKTETKRNNWNLAFYADVRQKELANAVVGRSSYSARKFDGRKKAPQGYKAFQEATDSPVIDQYLEDHGELEYCPSILVTHSIHIPAETVNWVREHPLSRRTTDEDRGRIIMRSTLDLSNLNPNVHKEEQQIHALTAVSQGEVAGVAGIPIEKPQYKDIFKGNQDTTS